MSVPQEGFCTQAKIIKVVDADTLDLIIERKVRVRLLDCWQAESRTENGKLAKKYLIEDILHGQTNALLFVPASPDEELQDILTLGRVLGKVYVDGVDIGEALIEGGFGSRKK